jgi:hypothetical protein
MLLCPHYEGHNQEGGAELTRPQHGTCSAELLLQPKLILYVRCDLLRGSLTTTFGGANLALTVNRRCLPVWQKAAGGLLQLAAAFDPTLCCSMVRRSRTIWGIGLIVVATISDLVPEAAVLVLELAT